MDIILQDHSKEQLEQIFQNHYLYDHPLYSLMANATKIPWLQFIPKQSLENREYAATLYGEIHKVAFALQAKGYGHFNLAKIGNKLPYYHIHLVFRKEGDEVWPDAIWCHEPLQKEEKQPERLKSDLADCFIGVHG